MNGVQGVGGSNPLAPTKNIKHLGGAARVLFCLGTRFSPQTDHVPAPWPIVPHRVIVKTRKAVSHGISLHGSSMMKILPGGNNFGSGMPFLLILAKKNDKDTRDFSGATEYPLSLKLPLKIVYQSDFCVMLKL
jgi:hypothetical protein